MTSSPAIGIIDFGTYFPPQIETAADLVDVTGIPEAVLREKWASASGMWRGTMTP